MPTTNVTIDLNSLTPVQLAGIYAALHGDPEHWDIHLTILALGTAKTGFEEFQTLTNRAIKALTELKA